ncbi:MAG: hypothetical protein JWM80_1532 [Cyanobacteria bacterium RYN_339]|nr:hypothetical protein [Cyanobacteria bacterium RYN_339]
MARRFALVAPVLLLLAACQATAVVKPAAVHSSAPLAPTASAAPAAGVPSPVTAAATAAFRPVLPKALAVVLPGAFNGIISEHGGAIISNHGSSLIANNGGAYQLADAGFPVGSFVGSLLNPYLTSRKALGDILTLAEANQEDLFAGRTVPLIAADGKGSFMAMKTFADHAEFTAWDDDGATRVPFLWVSYPDAEHGEAIAHGPVGKDGKRGYLVHTRFDLVSGTTTEDVYFNNYFGSGLSRVHYEVTVKPGAGVGLVQATGVLRQVNEGPPDGRVALAARTRADDSGAALLGLRADTEAAPGYAFQPPVYLGPDGVVLAAGKADAALQAIVPTQADISASVPADPKTTDPYTDPTFVIPK